MIITQQVTPKDIAAKFSCPVRAIAQLLRDRRIPVVGGAIDPSLIIIYGERLQALAKPQSLTRGVKV